MNEKKYVRTVPNPIFQNPEHIEAQLDDFVEKGLTVNLYVKGGAKRGKLTRIGDGITIVNFAILPSKQFRCADVKEIEVGTCTGMPNIFLRNALKGE